MIAAVIFLHDEVFIMAISLKEPLLARLLHYVKIHTTSDAKSDTVPSTPQQ